MVQGRATRRLLRVFTALFSWFPGGLALATVAICTVFTFAGSGLTILSLGGLLVPMLIRTRLPENSQWDCSLHQLPGPPVSNQCPCDSLLRVFANATRQVIHWSNLARAGDVGCVAAVGIRMD